MSVVIAQKQFLFDLIGEFRIAMLVKPCAVGPSFVRPVLIAHLEQDGHAIVASRLQDDEAEAFDSDGTVILTLQTTDQFAWMRGTATIERSRDEIERLWKPDWIDWFPKGPIDSSICLLKIESSEGEYWDRRVVGGFEQVLESAKAFLVGAKQTDCPPHGKVKLSKPRSRSPETGRPRTAKPDESSENMGLPGAAVSPSRDKEASPLPPAPGRA